MKRLLLVALFLETGFLLIVIPWFPYWDRNYFAQWVSPLHTLMTNNFVRGAVSGLGIVNIAAGLAELLSLVLGYRRIESPSTSLRVPPHAAEE